MCTVTWTRTADGYVLFSNRDERDSRELALGPRVNALSDVKYIAPVDGDHGGSWIGVNHYGLTLCLLNRYGDIPAENLVEFTSRGLLLIELIDSRLAESVVNRIKRLDLLRYRPFTLLVLTTVAPALIVHWNGREFYTEDNAERHVPLTSSSAAEPGIAAERLRQFEVMKNGSSMDQTLLEQFHRSHLPVRGPYSVCMHRDGAKTVSLSRISVSRREIRFRYWPGSPCEQSNSEEVGLARVMA